MRVQETKELTSPPEAVHASDKLTVNGQRVPQADDVMLQTMGNAHLDLGDYTRIRATIHFRADPT